MSQDEQKVVLEAILLAADRPLSLRRLAELLSVDGQVPERDELRRLLGALQQDWQARGGEVVEVASGYRLQVAERFEPWISRLWEEKPPRYSRALLETLALVAYRQPITRAEIEDVRGVSVSTQIVKTLLERDWIQVLGHKDTPGRPAMFGTTRQFLDYFNLRSLEELPSLAELKDIDSMNPELELEAPVDGQTEAQTEDGTEAQAEGGSGDGAEAQADEQSAEPSADSGDDRDRSPLEAGGVAG